MPELARLARWRFEDGALTADAAGGNTLTSTSSPTADLVDFKEGSASASFASASSQYLTIDDAALDSGFPLKGGETKSTGTLCFFARINSFQVSGWRWFFGKGYNWGLFIGYYLGGKLEVDAYDTDYNNSDYLSSSGVFALNTWYHISAAVALDKITVRIWDVDGDALVFNEEIPLVAPIAIDTAGEADVFLARVGSYYGNINLDDFQVYGEILTTSQMDEVRTTGGVAVDVDLTLTPDPILGTGSITAQFLPIQAEFLPVVQLPPGPWPFQEQESKYGYQNNPNWLDPSTIDYAHHPCGHWHKTREIMVPPLPWNSCPQGVAVMGNYLYFVTTNDAVINDTLYLVRYSLETWEPEIVYTYESGAVYIRFWEEPAIAFRNVGDKLILIVFHQDGNVVGEFNNYHYLDAWIFNENGLVARRQLDLDTITGDSGLINVWLDNRGARFIDENHWQLVVPISGDVEKVYFFETLDGGQNWSNVEICVGGKTGYLVVLGTDLYIYVDTNTDLPTNQIYKSTDAGATWSTIITNFDDNLAGMVNDFYVFDSKFWLFVSDAGAIKVGQSTDGATFTYSAAIGTTIDVYEETCDFFEMEGSLYAILRYTVTASDGPETMKIFKLVDDVWEFVTQDVDIKSHNYPGSFVYQVVGNVLYGTFYYYDFNDSPYTGERWQAFFTFSETVGITIYPTLFYSHLSDRASPRNPLYSAVFGHKCAGYVWPFNEQQAKNRAVEGKGYWNKTSS